MEVLVAVGIFSVIMVVISGIFTTILTNQSQVLSEQLTVSNTSYAFEYMSRSMRTAKKDASGSCISEGSNFENPDDNPARIKFLNHDEECVEFALEDGQLRRSDLSGEPAFTSERLDVKNLEFKLQGEEQGDQKQPSVTILLRAETGQGVPFRAQTTVTQRNLDVPR